MMFIDCDGYTLMPFTENVLEAAETAKRENGRLRLVVSEDISTTDPAVGCIILGDWRKPL